MKHSLAISCLLLGLLITPMAAAVGEPAPPSNVSATSQGPDRIFISWTIPTDTGDSPYDVTYVCTAPGDVDAPGADCTGHGGTGATKTGLAAGTNYCYNLQTKNDNNKYSTPVQTCATTDELAPSTATAPTNLQVTPSNQILDLSWNAPSNDGGATITSYRIYLDGAFVENTPSSPRQYQISGLNNGQSYLVEVAAINAAGTGAKASQTATPAIGPESPDAPNPATALATGSSSIEVSWPSVGNWGDSAADSYCVFESPGLYGGTQRGCTTGTTLTVTSLTASTQYCFLTYAVNANNHWSAPSNEACATTTAGAATLPREPTSVTLATGESKITIDWSPPSNDGGGAIQEYRIYQDSVLVSTQAEQVRSFIVDGLTNGQEYTIEVAAKNEAGEGPKAGGAATPAPLAGAPGQPQALTASSDDSRNILLNWTASTGDVDGYKIHHTDSGLTEFQGTATSQVISGLNPGTQYCFQVQAFNSVGDSARSSQACATTLSDDTPPSAPLNLAAVPFEGRVDLSWSPPSDEGSLTIIEYLVYVDGALHGTTTNNPYSILDLTNGQEYEFQVSARNGFSEGPKSSVTATPRIPAAPGPVQGLVADDGNKAVQLTWAIPEDDGGRDVDFYRIYVDGAFYSQTTEASAIIINLVNGVQYEFAVTASNEIGESQAATTTATPNETASFTIQSGGASPEKSSSYVYWIAGGTAVVLVSAFFVWRKP